MKALKKRPVHMKYPHHLNLAKGGAVVQKFADGGPAVASGAVQGQPLSATMQAAAPAGNLSGPSNGGVSTTAATGAGQTGLVGTISNALGTQNQFQGQSANINQGTNAGQLNTAYGGAQGALNQQGQIANQLTPQVGSAVTNQNMLANQYAAMSQGQGPNPAQTELNTATGQNVAAQAALMAGQRGASANAGLMARQAAGQGAATQQQAVGQGATLEAQQQIAAQQNLAGLSNNQINQAGNATGAASTAQQNEQNILQNANTSANNAAVGMQSNINNVNSQTAAANQNANANVASGIGGMLSNVPVIGSLFAKGGAVQNYDDGGGVNIPATATLPVPQTSSGGGGGGMSGLASLAMLALAKGGQIAPSPLSGAPMANDQWMAPTFAQSNAAGSQGDGGTAAMPASSKALTTLGSNHEDATPTPENAGQGPTAAAAATQNADIPYAQPTYSSAFAVGGRIDGPHRSSVANFFADGGKTGDVKALVSPKEIYLTPEQVGKVVHEGADPVKIGHHFPGTDKVKGKDSKRNDIIPTTLRAGGVVIPVHITTHKEASERGRKFVARTMAKHMKRPK